MMSRKCHKALLAGVMVMHVMGGASAQAQSLADLLPELMTTDQGLMASQADVRSATEGKQVAWGDWFPQLQLQSWAGHERQYRPVESGGHSKLAAKEFDASVSQLLWDFGKTNAKIDVAILQEIQARESLRAARQSLVLDAATAYINVMKAAEALRYATVSEANIRKQTGLEEARVQKGGGYTTDVLQAKSQLAGAQARRVRSEGQLVAARNRFSKLFGDREMNIGEMRWPGLPASSIPGSLGEALAVSESQSSVLKSAKLRESVARDNSRISRSAGFFPRVELVASHNTKKDVSQIDGVENDMVAKVQVTMPFNLGGTAINTLRGADEAAEAATHRAKSTQDQVVESVKNAWQELATAKENAAYLRNQANIAGEFLELARKEREHGTRSLLDVLNGETVFINAQSDAVAAEGDVLQTMFKLLYAMGVLEDGLIVQVADNTAGKPLQAVR